MTNAWSSEIICLKIVIIILRYLSTDHISVVTIKSTMTQNNGTYGQIPAEVISAIYEMSKGANMLLVEKLVCVQY